jgi:hypothetical protein
MFEVFFWHSKLSIHQLGLPPVEQWREEMYFYALQKITSHDDDEYRDTWDVIGG